MSDGFALQIKTPRWSVPLLAPKRYKGARGGRASGKSHFIAELLVEESVLNPDLRTVCIREIQKSMKFSSKQIIQDKIKALGVSHLFDITLTEIRRIGGDGIFIFQGMQDHTADSIKSLEGFDRAWVEEAQSISAHSMKLLLPTIRKPESQILFTWNPDQPEDAVEKLFRSVDEEDFTLVTVNYTENPFCPAEILKEADRHKRYDPESFDHVWMGGFNVKNEAQIFNGKWRSDELILPIDAQPIYGLDFGFSQDPTAGVEVYVVDEVLYIRREAGKVALELDDTVDFYNKHIPEMAKHVVRADNARPETISYLKRKGMPKITAVSKGKGSVEDGITFMRSFKEIVIHPSCAETIQEFRLYSYKINKSTGDIMPDIVDKNNHYIDAIRYALEPMIKRKDFIFM